MTDPERLFETSDDEVARLILKAGRAGAPPGARERALALASSVVAGSSLAAGSAAAGSGVVAGKVGFLGALAGFKGLAVVGIACVATVAASVAIKKTWQAPTSRIEITLVAPSASLPFAPRASNVAPVPRPPLSSPSRLLSSLQGFPARSDPPRQRRDRRRLSRTNSRRSIARATRSTPATRHALYRSSMATHSALPRASWGRKHRSFASRRS